MGHNNQPPRANDQRTLILWAQQQEGGQLDAYAMEKEVFQNLTSWAWNNLYDTHSAPA
jgi:hypothetical protein